MRIVVDTNVFISGVFFAGVPYRILDAWRCGIVQIAISPQILDEYRRVGSELARKFPNIEIDPWLELLTAESIWVDPPAMREQVCRDLDDDKFLACAIASKTKTVVSGDKALLETSGYAGITVLTPRAFVERHLNEE
jgi:uncharacterized protein